MFKIGDRVQDLEGAIGQIVDIHISHIYSIEYEEGEGCFTFANLEAEDIKEIK